MANCCDMSYEEFYKTYQPLTTEAVIEALDTMDDPNANENCKMDVVVPILISKLPEDVRETFINIDERSMLESTCALLKYYRSSGSEKIMVGAFDAVIGLLTYYLDHNKKEEEK